MILKFISKPFWVNAQFSLNIVLNIRDLVRGLVGRAEGNCNAYQCAQCTEDRHCSYSQKCSLYFCVATSNSRSCTQDSHCLYGEICSGYNCVTHTNHQSCTQDSHCFGSQKCVGYKCVLGAPTGRSCTQDSHCQYTERCSRYQCVGR